MKFTKIQWCDSTVNPVMGCDGCELWPTSKGLIQALVNHVVSKSRVSSKRAKAAVREALGGQNGPTKIWHARQEISASLSQAFVEVNSFEVLEMIKARFRCYAGIQHMMRGATPADWAKPNVTGFAAVFEEPEAFAGRMRAAAKWGDLRGRVRGDAPWLNGLPRLIFVSDMGDALSESIDFDFLKTEIIDVVSTENGQRHVWLWLTKRPARMAEFAKWLEEEQGLDWPENLVAMTSVTNRATRTRVGELLQVPAKVRGLSVEPLVEQVDLELDGIDWVIVGGESGNSPREFDIEWARSLQRQCEAKGVAFFVKQFGANAVEDGFPVPLVDGHGGDWNEWPTDLRVREMPAEFAFVVSALNNTQKKRQHDARPM